MIHVFGYSIYSNRFDKQFPMLAKIGTFSSGPWRPLTSGNEPPRPIPSDAKKTAHEIRQNDWPSDPSQREIIFLTPHEFSTIQYEQYGNNNDYNRWVDGWGSASVEQLFNNKFEDFRGNSALLFSSWIVHNRILCISHEPDSGTREFHRAHRADTDGQQTLFGSGGSIWGK